MLKAEGDDVQLGVRHYTHIAPYLKWDFFVLSKVSFLDQPNLSSLEEVVVLWTNSTNPILGRWDSPLKGV